MRKPAFPGQTSDVSNIRKTKKCCKHAQTSFTRANIRYVKNPKNQKVLQTYENQLYQGKHPICQTTEKSKSAAIIRKPALPWQTADMPNIRNNKIAANIRKAAFPAQTSDMPNIRKTKKCWKHAKTSFTRANIRYFKHPKNEKVLQTCENQLYEGKHPICQTFKNQKVLQTSEKQLLQGKHPICQISEKNKECCKHPKSSFSRANIRYVKHPKNQTVLQTCENQLYQGKQSICQTSKNQNVLQTSEKKLFQSKHPICQTSEKKTKSAANIRKAAFQGQTSDVSNIRKTKKCCKHVKTSFTRANIRYVKHPKNQKVLQLSEDQLYHGKHLICQTSEKAKVL